MHMAVPQRHKLQTELVKICQITGKLEWRTSAKSYTECMVVPNVAIFLLKMRSRQQTESITGCV